MRPTKIKAAFSSVLLLTLVASFSVSNVWAAGTENVLYNFNAANGNYATSGVTLDANGNLYGTAFYGGGSAACTAGCGVVFKLAPNSSGGWTESTIYTFTGAADGSHPYSPLLFDAAGNLYGTTYGGGTGLGTAFKLSPVSGGGWVFSVLHTFTGGKDGSRPSYSQVLDSAGNLYGMTFTGGIHDSGVVYQLKPTPQGEWQETILHTYGADGVEHSGLLIDPAGNLYAATYPLSCLCGVVFELSPMPNGSWTRTVLHSFTSGYPALLARDSAGRLYGSTWIGEGEIGRGGLFQLAPTSGSHWDYSVLTKFDSGNAAPTGLAADNQGNLYGVAYSALSVGLTGMILEFTPGSTGWNTQTLYVFQDSFDGGYPMTNIVLDSAGNLYGTTRLGGSSNYGVAFQIPNDAK